MNRITKSDLALSLSAAGRLPVEIAQALELTPEEVLEIVNAKHAENREKEVARAFAMVGLDASTFSDPDPDHRLNVAHIIHHAFKYGLETGRNGG